MFKWGGHHGFAPRYKNKANPIDQCPGSEKGRLVLQNLLRLGTIQWELLHPSTSFPQSGDSLTGRKHAFPSREVDFL